MSDQKVYVLEFGNAAKQINSCKLNEIANDYDQIISLRRSDIKRIARCFDVYMLDAVFRRKTFDHDHFTRYQREELSQNGLYSMYIKNAISREGSYDSLNRSTYFRLRCAFCNFYIFETISDINVTNIRLRHAVKFPTCPRNTSTVRDRNVPYISLTTTLGFVIRQYECIRTLFPERMFEISDRPDHSGSGMDCIICTDNRRCIYFQCGHITLCYACFQSDSFKYECPICRCDVRMYARVKLPELHTKIVRHRKTQSITREMQIYYNI